MKRNLVAVLAVAALVPVGCGGDDEKDASKPAEKKPAGAQATTTSNASAEIPSYETVKSLAMKDPRVKAQCAKSEESLEIGSPKAGEDYRRLVCGGAPVLDYVVGEEQVDYNFEASKKFTNDPIWVIPGKAYVKPEIGRGPRKIAADLKAECGCGESLLPKS